MCKRYMDTLASLGRTEEALTISTQVTKVHPQSVELWLARLELLSAACGQAGGGKTKRSKASKKKGGVRVCEVCRDALDKVPAKVGLYMYVYNVGTSFLVVKRAKGV